MRSSASGLLALGVALFTSGSAAAQTEPPSQPAPLTAHAPEPPAVTPPAPPYSLPWQLRPTAVANVVRADSSIAFYRGTDPARPAEGEVGGSTVATLLTGTYKINNTFAPLVRVGFVRNADPSSAAGSGAAFMNPIVGLMGAWRLPSNLRLSALVATSIPIGGGGSAPAGRNATASAISRGVGARSAMDNAMFAVNYITPLIGADLAWVAHKLTVQAELNFFQLIRTRNEFCADGMTRCAPESMRTNATSGIHVGYFLHRLISLGGELRYQRYISTPELVKANAAARDSTTFAVGPRMHFQLGDNMWVRPGISYSRALDQPLSNSKYNILHIDVPVVF
jgi:hypothetical protein